MNDKLLKPYDPTETEPRIYTLWEESGFFNPDTCIEKSFTKKDAETFSMIMPPPNVTGVLHMGHGLMLSVQDIMVRYNRMQGKRTLWIPGTDHAAIATQSKVEKEILKAEGKSRHDLGREEMLSRINTFAKESHDTIVSQMKKMGVSADWSREAFTLDEQRSHAVKTVFKKMHDDGLIYRGYRIVNWDPKGQTTVSDDEVVHEERKSKLYTFKYSKDFPISISTTRPETKVGDVAVAVHPTDERYKEFVGKEYDAIFCGVSIHIKIVADESVEKDFGTGALGVTPAHSQIDWDIAQKNNLEVKPVINEFAKMTVGDSNLLGKKVAEAREVIVEWLKSEHLLEKEEDVTQNVSTAERTGGIIEPLPKLQWFIDVNKKFILPQSKIDGIPSGSETTLKEIMKKTVELGQIKIIPEYFDKTYFHWIDGLKDWCISRQIWYGHRIPVWYKNEEIIVGEKPEGENWDQDSDTLDTWFSSALWTFSTLGWPEKTEDFVNYHPTNVLETGHEILFFWVARMILMSGYVLGDIPFKDVYLHGTVRDEKGRKMSKSLGNGIDPIDVAEKFGADAGRMSLIVGTAPGTDSKISENKIKAYKHFANKIWNIERFVLTSVDSFPIPENFDESTLTSDDKKLLEDLQILSQDITKDLEEYRFHIASEKIYQYVWHEFADVLIESSKIIFSEADESAKISRSHTLLKILETSLKLLHPFMPFVTEELWSFLPNRKNFLIVEQWPS